MISAKRDFSGICQALLARLSGDKRFFPWARVVSLYNSLEEDLKLMALAFIGAAIDRKLTTQVFDFPSTVLTSRRISHDKVRAPYFLQ